LDATSKVRGKDSSPKVKHHYPPILEIDASGLKGEKPRRSESKKGRSHGKKKKAAKPSKKKT